MSIEPVNSANAHSARSAMSIPQCPVHPRVMPWNEQDAGTTWMILRRPSPGIVGERQHPPEPPAVWPCFLRPLIDVAPTARMQAPTGHLFNYPKKLIGDVEDREAPFGIVDKSHSSPGRTKPVLATFGGIVPLPCYGRKLHLFNNTNKFAETGSGLQASMSERSSTTSSASAKSSSLK
ncbi:hypothetical protein ABIF38_007673 [Bradyrhizobium japonicum]|jgi:hypothetical protein|uniref:hypothetical protein n=1 Tax=Bradyrhizobium TaxID=374 RepID=UPI00101F3B69|nr:MULTISPECIES: hypothetical protein [Bradyrhizobium]MCP1730012.1 hypothetical protein [Bradyrhizobium elkanii]MCP1930467.1 hypothetical protein [Bradyrhizobium elkanii]MCS3481274.1 hypothetical protein [Bradyrhizobium elkanii]MCS3518118.1 hypothetical protein [Bradyrhizobium elkanii]MCS3574141.1 hypothetical protein [Bradyrhizobium elkanii]